MKEWGGSSIQAGLEDKYEFPLGDGMYGLCHSLQVKVKSTGGQMLVLNQILLRLEETIISVICIVNTDNNIIVATIFLWCWMYIISYL